MKKFVILAATALVVAFASCGGNKSQGTEESADSAQVFEQQQIEASVKMHIDSLVSQMGEKKFQTLTEKLQKGDVALSEDEIKVKPDYLLDPAISNDLLTAAQKYAGMVMLRVDQEVAAFYKMDTAPYGEAVAKLAAEIDDPAYKVATTAAEDADFATLAEDMYKAEEDAGRINFFWIGTCAGMVEDLYIMSQNIDKYLDNYTDDQVSAITFHLICILDALDRLSVYDSQIVGITEGLEPLKKINANTVADFKKQLAEVKEEIAASRDSLLK